MPTLAYWKTRGLAQPIRLLLHYIGQDFDDVKFEMGEGPEFNKEEWLSKKFTFGLEFPNIPLYIDGDVKISQSNAIIRYLGRKHDVAGKTEQERIMVDMLLDYYKDLRNSIDNVTYSPDYDNMKSELFDSMKKEQLPLLEARLSKGNPWFIGEEVTIVDFPLYEILDNLRAMKTDILDGFPKLKEFMSRLEELPEIKRYMASDKFMRSPINNKFASFIG